MDIKLLKGLTHNFNKSLAAISSNYFDSFCLKNRFGRGNIIFIPRIPLFGQKYTRAINLFKFKFYWIWMSFCNIGYYFLREIISLLNGSSLEKHKNTVSISIDNLTFSFFVEFYLPNCIFQNSLSSFNYRICYIITYIFIALEVYITCCIKS